MLSKVLHSEMQANLSKNANRKKSISLKPNCYLSGFPENFAAYNLQLFLKSIAHADVAMSVS